MKNWDKRKKKIVGLLIAAAVVVALIFAGVVYVNDYYKATDTAMRAILTNEKVSVTDTKGYYHFDLENKEATKGIVFYPGGKVDEAAYAPLLSRLAEMGYEVYLVKMPAKLAMFNANAAEDIMKEASHIKEWTMMGHSLGGAMAASFSASHDKEVDQLVLLAAYSTEDISSLEIEVFSIYGSEDKVLNMDNYKKYKGNLPKDMVEEVIHGGNHAYFGYYGEQDGDGKATITRREQQETVLDVFQNLQ